jgi:hypothetical protein
MKRVFNKTSNIFSNIASFNNAFNSTLIQKFSKIKVYNALALLNLLYGSETLNLKEMTSIEIKFFRRTVGYVLFGYSRIE